MTLTNIPNGNGPSAGPKNSARQKIQVPDSQGGKWRLTNKLREEGILGPKQTIRQYNAAIDSDLSESLNPQDDQQPAPEGLEIESHSQDDRGGFGGLLDKATRALKTQDDLPKSKKVTPRAREDFAVLVVSVLTLLVTFAKIEESVKPNTDEINLFSDHLSGILLRHLPINKNLSADALDIIGMMAVTATWYSRVKVLEPARTQPGPSQLAQPIPVKQNGHQPQQLDPLEPFSPEAANWLNNIAIKSEGLA